jgi:hypothetical protein
MLSVSKDPYWQVLAYPNRLLSLRVDRSTDDLLYGGTLTLDLVFVILAPVNIVEQGMTCICVLME